MILRAHNFKFVFPRPAMVMGVVNVTPDSFSDGGQFLKPDAAVAHAMQLAAEGADIIDVGGESSRPFAEPVSEAEEMRRVLPVIEQLAGRIDLPISIDTQKPAVARAAIHAGASIVNDVAANRRDSDMGQIIAKSRAGYVLVHMQGTPQTMQLNPTYTNVLQEIWDFFVDHIEWLTGLGVSRDQIILDAGIGFGKKLEHNLELISSLNRFIRLGRPLLLGASRKSFIGQLLKLDEMSRLPGALACACWGVAAGAQIVRTHDVAATVAAMRMTEALLTRQK